MSGVIPPIFASSIILFPATVVELVRAPATGLRWLKDLAGAAAPGPADLRDAVRRGDRLLLLLLHGAACSTPQETADNLKKSGAFIPGIRPGDQTARYIDKILIAPDAWPARSTSRWSACCPSS